MSDRQELPPWYRPSLIVDFVIWPGMRERLVLLGDMAALSGLWRSYINSFRFYWPGRLEDAFETNHDGDQYKLSGEFYNRFHDLSHWRMDADFFVTFPAFVDDILPTQTILQNVHLWSEADVLEVRRMGLEDHESTDDGFEYGHLDDSQKQEGWREENSECEQAIKEHEYTTQKLLPTSQIQTFHQLLSTSFDLPKSDLFPLLLLQLSLHWRWCLLSL
ncbi:hypothetical protein BJX70DRAFT_399324 [Aspergillus crustosus]